LTDLFATLQPMKAISLWQPWASLIAAALKIDETRHWSTDHRGLIAIHAAKRLDVAGAPDTLCLSAFGHAWPDSLPRGAIVAVGQLRAVAPGDSLGDTITRANRTAGNFAPGRFAWRLGDVQALKAPIPYLGRQGLFNWTPPEDLAQRLGPILDHREICRRLGWA
jgi:hypothetical protein